MNSINIDGDIFSHEVGEINNIFFELMSLFK